jgi:hypothetical protein
MKYFVQFEGREKLVVKLLLLFQLIITVFLVTIILTESPIDVHFEREDLKILCNRE